GLRQGNVALAVRIQERGLACCREWSVSSLIPQTVSGLGYALALSGRTKEALALLDEGVAYGLKIQRMDHHAIRLAWLSEGYLMAGRIDEASATAARALEAARRHGEHGSEAWIHRLLGELLLGLRAPDAEAIELHYRHALSLGGEMGMRPLVAHCHLGLE